MLALKVVYLDNAATTPVSEASQKAVTDTLLNRWGNPSSLHTLGVKAEAIVSEARHAVAAALGARAEEIVFTSGGTEANALALLGAARTRARRKRHIITTTVEHPSVLNVCALLEEQGFDVTRVPVDGQGIVDVESIVAQLRDDTALVSVMAVNNEIGAVQPVRDIAEAVKEADEEVLLHVDAVQALGKIPLHLTETQFDLVSLSAHKIGGPKGSGALWVREGTPLRSPLGGGSQERGLRPGTENVPGIAGFGAAAREVRQTLQASSRIARLRDTLWHGIKAGLAGKVRLRRNGPVDPQQLAPHIVNISFVGLKGEVLVHGLAEVGVYASTGSACSSRRKIRGGPLRAMGLTDAEVEGALRFSLSEQTTEEDIQYAVRQIVTVAKQLYEFVR